MTGYLRRSGLPDASGGAVDQATKALRLNEVRRDKGIRTTIPSKDGNLLNRDFSVDTVRKL